MRRLLANAAGMASLRHCVTFEDIAVSVVANHKPAVDWISAYLGGYLSVTAPAPGVATVVAVVDAQLHRDLLATLCGSAREEVVTHRSDTTDAGPRWTWKKSARYQLADDLTVHVYREGSGITISDRLTSNYAFASTQADDDAVREPARIVRELLTLELERRGGIALHAGAVVLDGVGTILCGPRGSGKTTLLTALLEYEAATFLANDRMFVTAAASGTPRAIAWPWAVRLGLGTCATSPALRRWLRPGRTYTYPQKDWDEKVWEWAADQGDGGFTEIKVELTATEFAAAIGTSLKSSTSVGCLIIPDLDADARSAEAHQMAAGEAVDRLHEEVEHLVADVYTDWLDLGLTSRGPLDAHAREIVARLVEAIPILRLRYWNAREAAAVVRELVAASNAETTGG